MTRLIPFILTIFLLSGCESYQYSQQRGSGLEFYLIRDFQREGSGAKIINSIVTLSDSVIISYDEIVSYDSVNFTFTVTGICAGRLNNFESNNFHGTPFAVTIDKEIIYTGYFWYGYSSASVGWVTIDPLNYSGRNQLRVSLGYPGLIIGDYIPDNRNDCRILNLLMRDGKLKE
ncbi:MAG: hypothetical protein ACM3RX_03430 [Methanococcaceae archaeon]